MLRVQAEYAHHQYESVLPSPADMTAYEAIQPGALDRILRMAETNQAHRMEQGRKEAEHRHALEWKNLEKHYNDQRLLTIVGVWFLFLFVAAAFFFGAKGNFVMAGLFLSPPVITALLQVLHRQSK